MSAQLAGLPRFNGRVPTTESRLRQPTNLFRIFMAVLAAGTVGAVIFLTWLVFVKASPGPGLLAVAIWAVWTLVLYGLTGLVDVYRHVPASTRLACWLWGAGVAPLLALLVETALNPILSGAADAFSTGLIEETTKLLGVILIAALVPVLFQRPMGGLLTGMMVGLGFCFLENIEYSIQASITGSGADEPYASVASALLTRGFVAGAGLHVVLTGLTGLGVAYFVSHRGSPSNRRWAGALAFVIGAVLFHFLWDWGATMHGVGGTLLILTLNVLHFVMIGVMIIYAVRAERRWLANAAVDDETVIEPAERDTLRKRRTRRRARASVADPSDRHRMKTRQWAQIGYADAVADDAPRTETDRLAGYVGSLRQPDAEIAGSARLGDIPPQREPSPSDQQHPTESSG